ncbi:MAG: tetratricopeptide repeat protein [Aureispira sp.]
MRGKSIEGKLQEKGLTEAEIDQLLADLAEVKIYKKDYLKWRPTAINALLNYIKTRLNISEGLDVMLFNILESCLKAYPAKSILLQKEIVEAMKGFVYPEYYMSKCMSLIEIGAAIYHWEEALVIDMGTALIKNTKKQNKNIDDEYGGTYYEVLKSLEPLVDNPKVTKAVRSYYVLDYRDKKKHPYKEEATVIKNRFSVYVSTGQYDRAIAFFQEKIEQIPEKDIHKRYYMYLDFAETYHKLGDYDKARATAKIAQEIRPTQESAYYFVAALYQEEENKAACLAEYEWAYKQVGNKNYILEDQLKAMNEYGYFSEALEIANDLIEKDY